MFTSKSFPFWLFTLSAIFILTLSQLIQDGVFMDGMLYISVSKNLSEGLGNFWEPHFSKTVMMIFREQPPLYFGLLSVFFKIFGSSMYVERLFCFVCFTATLYTIVKIWKSIFTDSKAISSTNWLPVLFFCTIPVVFWSYANHVEETVMTLFATLSVYFSYHALFRAKNVIINIILAGLFVFLSSLTKGIQGMFPLSAVFFYWMIKKEYRFKQNLIYSTLLFSIPFLVYGSLFLAEPHILETIQLYLENRLGIAFNGTMHNTTSNRFEIMQRLFFELLPMFGMMLIFNLWNRKWNKGTKTEKQIQITALWFLLIGLSGSIPLMSTLEQRGFYLLTSLPMFAIAGALLCAPAATGITEKLNTSSTFFKRLKWIMLLLFFISIGYTLSCIGKTKRDKEMLHDVYAFGKIIPRGEIISIPHEMWERWNFQTYMIRFNYISLEALDRKNKYFVIEKSLPKNLVPDGYQVYPVKTEYLDLYKLKN